MSKHFSLIYFLLFILLCNLAVGVGIGQYSSQKQILFEPGTEKVYTFMLMESMHIDATLEGDLAKYAVINDPSPGGAMRNIDVILKMPEFLDPGVHTLYVVATEKKETTATVGGIASVKVGVEVFALYPGKHPKSLGLIMHDVNINDSTTMGIMILNQGEETIESAHGNISIFGPNGSLVTVLDTDSKSIAPYESVTLNSGIDTSQYNLEPGTYKAVGVFTYDGVPYPESIEGFFIVGQMNVRVADTTKELFVNSTNKFQIALESDWSNDIDNVYAKITAPNGKSIKTQSVDILKSGQGVKAAAMIETFVETDGLPLGQNDFDITIYYKGLSASKQVSINIIDGKPPEIEKQSLITPMRIFVAISALIVIFIIMYFFVFRKGNNGQRNTQYSAPNQGTNEIRPPTL